MKILVIVILYQISLNCPRMIAAAVRLFPVAKSVVWPAVTVQPSSVAGNVLRLTVAVELS